VEDLRIVLRAGTVKELAVDPPNAPNPDRIPVTDAHRRGVVDPLSAALVRVSGNGDLVSPEACRGVILVFDGRMRFDLQLSFGQLGITHGHKLQDCSARPLSFRSRRRSGRLSLCIMRAALSGLMGRRSQLSGNQGAAFGSPRLLQAASGPATRAAASRRRVAFMQQPGNRRFDPRTRA
jgi:hypothetical protein